jgi:two-component system, LytTR family, sensor kinase
MKIHRTWYHIAFWLAYFLFEVYIEYAWMSSAPSYKDLSEWKKLSMSMQYEAVMFIVKVPLTYFILYLATGFTAKYKDPFLAILLGVAAFFLCTAFHRILIAEIVLPIIYDDRTISTIVFTIPRILSSLIDLMFIVGGAFAIKQFRINQRSRHREKLLQKEKLEAELKFLRTQTNPHFLFNTLNNIYALARKKSDDTANVVMKLSKLLRFMLYESRNDSISIAEEIRVLEDYIELERIRYNERLTVNFNKSIDCDSQAIAPLILLPFVENAFKHGASEARFNSYIYIDITLQDGQLQFKVENSKDEEPERPMTENIGLSNVRRQLELMYPEHKLQVQNEKNKFYIHLTINLKKHATVSMHHSGR